MDTVENGIEALTRLVEVVLNNNGHSIAPIKEFLAGLYNDDFAPSCWLLCTRISDENFEDVLSVMKLIRITRKEPHEFFTNGSNLWMKNIVKGLRRYRASRWD